MYLLCYHEMVVWLLLLLFVGGYVFLYIVFICPINVVLSLFFFSLLLLLMFLFKKKFPLPSIHFSAFFLPFSSCLVIAFAQCLAKKFRSCFLLRVYSFYILAFRLGKFIVCTVALVHHLVHVFVSISRFLIF